MSKLNVKVTHHPAQVSEDGEYTIKGVTAPQPSKYGSAIVLTVLNKDREQRAVFVPYSSEVTDQTNLGRLVNAFTDETNQWIGKRINVTIESNQRTIEPVAKP